MGHAAACLPGSSLAVACPPLNPIPHSTLTNPETLRPPPNTRQPAREHGTGRTAVRPPLPPEPCTLDPLEPPESRQLAGERGTGGAHADDPVVAGQGSQGAGRVEGQLGGRGWEQHMGSAGGGPEVPDAQPAVQPRRDQQLVGQVSRNPSDRPVMGVAGHAWCECVGSVLDRGCRPAGRLLLSLGDGGLEMRWRTAGTPSVAGSVCHSPSASKADPAANLGLLYKPRALRTAGPEIDRGLLTQVGGCRRGWSTCSRPPDGPQTACCSGPGSRRLSPQRHGCRNG